MGSAVVIREWRIEVDPASAFKVDQQHLPHGYAFVTEDGAAGIVGRLAVGRQAIMPMRQDGTIYGDGTYGTRAAFHAWRIVTGSPDHPDVLINSDAFAIPIAT